MGNDLEVARVEAVRCWLRIVGVARILSPDGDIVRRPVQQVAGCLFMIPVHQENRCRAADQPEKRTLEGVALGHLGGADRHWIKRVDAEIIAHGQIKNSGLLAATVRRVRR